MGWMLCHIGEDEKPGFFSGLQLNSFVVAVAKPMWKWLKRLHGISVTPLVTISIHQDSANSNVQVQFFIKSC